MVLMTIATIVMMIVMIGRKDGWHSPKLITSGRDCPVIMVKVVMMQMVLLILKVMMVVMMIVMMVVMMFDWVIMVMTWATKFVRTKLCISLQNLHCPEPVSDFSIWR